jgi:outer membrane protein assembly factor BamB
MCDPIQPTKTTSPRKASQATRRKKRRSLIAVLQPAAPILARRITFPLLCLSAGLLLVAGRSASSSATAENVLKVLRLESLAGEGRSTSWGQAAFDPAHRAFNRVETILSAANVSGLTQAWASPVGAGFLYASPVVSGDKVFIGSGDGHMYAFDAATGATLWVGPTQSLFFVDSAAVGHGLVFANSLYSTLLAYDAETGAIAWTSNLTDVRASPTLSNRTLYIASLDGTLTALDAVTGKTKWKTASDCCVYDQAPVVDGDRVFQMRTNGTLTAYDANNGTQLWSKSEFSVGTQAAAYGLLFFNHYPNVVALDQATGEEVWTAPGLAGSTTGAPAVANGLVFVSQANLVALNAATGAVVWSAPKPTGGWGPVVANGVVYASSLSGEWDAFDERDGSLLWSVTVGSGCGGNCTNAVPVVANGTLYLAGPDQYLRAFRLSY